MFEYSSTLLSQHSFLCRWKTMKINNIRNLGFHLVFLFNNLHRFDPELFVKYMKTWGNEKQIYNKDMTVKMNIYHYILRNSMIHINVILDSKITDSNIHITETWKGMYCVNIEWLCEKVVNWFNITQSM